MVALACCVIDIDIKSGWTYDLGAVARGAFGTDPDGYGPHRSGGSHLYFKYPEGILLHHGQAYGLELTSGRMVAM